MNSCNMIGRMTADPELRRTGDGTPVCTFSHAVRRPRTKDVSDFVDFVAWRQSAEYLSQYGHKGDLVAVSGPLQSRKWTDKNGNNRTAFEVVANNAQFVESKRDSQATGLPAGEPAAFSNADSSDFAEISGAMDDDLPF